MLEFIQSNWVAVLGVLLTVSELLGAIPAIKSNSIFQLVVNVLKSFKPLPGPEKPKKDTKKP